MKYFLDPTGKLFRSRGNIGNLDWLEFQCLLEISIQASTILANWTKSSVQSSLPSIPVSPNGRKKESNKVKL